MTSLPGTPRASHIPSMSPRNRTLNARRGVRRPDAKARRLCPCRVKTLGRCSPVSRAVSCRATSPTRPNRAIPEPWHEARRRRLREGGQVAGAALPHASIVTRESGTRRHQPSDCHLPRAATCRRALLPLPLGEGWGRGDTGAPWWGVEGSFRALRVPNIGGAVAAPSLLAQPTEPRCGADRLLGRLRQRSHRLAAEVCIRGTVASAKISRIRADG